MDIYCICCGSLIEINYDVRTGLIVRCDECNIEQGCIECEDYKSSWIQLVSEE